MVITAEGCEDHISHFYSLLSAAISLFCLPHVVKSTVRINCWLSFTLKFFASDTYSGFGTWTSLYTGSDQWHYEDRGLTMYTTYQYRTTVYNDYAFTISPSSELVTTFGGIPGAPANVSALAINHTTIYVNWTVPSMFQHKLFIIFMNCTCVALFCKN
jgi:hypothetical protein